MILVWCRRGQYLQGAWSTTIVKPVVERLPVVQCTDQICRPSCILLLPVRPMLGLTTEWNCSVGQAVVSRTGEGLCGPRRSTGPKQHGLFYPDSLSGSFPGVIASCPVGRTILYLID